jgi:hypothetical protein
MPIMIPTPAEIRQMPWHERQRVKRIVRQLLATLDGATDHDGRRRRQSVRKAEVLQWARDVRREAKRLELQARVERNTHPDPDAEEHQRVLLEALTGGSGT